MKITLPQLAIVDNDLESNLNLTRVLEKALPCDIETYVSLPEFLENSGNVSYQLVFVDPKGLKSGNLAEGLEKIKQGHPEASLAIISRDPIGYEELKATSSLGIEKFLDKPREGESFTRMNDEAFNLINLLKRKRKVIMKTPIGLYGSGIVITALAKFFSEEDLDVFWYGKSLATNRYIYIKVGSQEIERHYGYKELMLLKDFSAPNRINCLNSFSAMTEANPGFIVFGGALQEKPKIKPGMDRSSKEFLKELYKNSGPVLDEFLEVLTQKGSDANLVFVSNPPEVLAYRAMMTGFDNTQLLTGGPDINRLRKLLPFYDLSLLGVHAKQIFEPELCRHEGRTLADIIKEKKISQWLDVKKFIQDKLDEWGVNVMLAYGETGNQFGYEDAARAVKKGILDVLAYNPPSSFGYYHKRFDAFFLGPSPEVHYWENGFHFHQPSESNCPPAYQIKIKQPKIRRALEEMAIQQRELALSNPIAF